MSYHSELVGDIEAFIGRAGMSEITLGRKALGDPHFVRQLRNGRRVWPETEAKVRQFIATYSPEAESPEARTPGRSAA
jgi:hypothetical protein